jgi:hypothetical protein
MEISMKRYLAATATAIVITTAAYADTHATVFLATSFDPAVNLNASELIGMRVYATEADINSQTAIAADGAAAWDDIGEINEIVLTRDGKVESVIVGVGGFIGIGEKNVAIQMPQLKFVSEEGQSGDFFLVIKASAASVADAPEYLLVPGLGVTTTSDVKSPVTSDDGQTIDVEEMSDTVQVPGDDAEPNPVVPQDALIPPAEIKSVPDK